MVIDYLSLENFWFQNCLRYDIFVVEGIDECKVLIFFMLLQFVLENVVKYGICLSGGGLIMINILQEDDKKLICLIEDNGIGINKFEVL